jgi:FkbM family methyltransferase
LLTTLYKDLKMRNLRSLIASKRENTVLRCIALLCQKYLRAYDNQFNWDINSNGEKFVLEAVMALVPGIVFDVGANRGTYARMCAGIPSVAQVHAFEISLPTFQDLEHNCRGLPKIKLNGFGLSDQAAEVEIYHAAESSDRTSVHQVEHGFASQVCKATVQTGDGYMSANGVERVSFLKIDVEGADLATLRGFKNAFQEHRVQAVQFEHGGPSVESRTFLRDIVRFLAMFDLRCFRLYPRTLERVDEYGYRMEDFQGRNYVALSPDLVQRLSGLISAQS